MFLLLCSHFVRNGKNLSLFSTYLLFCFCLKVHWQPIIKYTWQYFEKIVFKFWWRENVNTQYISVHYYFTILLPLREYTKTHIHMNDRKLHMWFSSNLSCLCVCVWSLISNTSKVQPLSKVQFDQSKKCDRLIRSYLPGNSAILTGKIKWHDSVDSVCDLASGYWTRGTKWPHRPTLCSTLNTSIGIVSLSGWETLVSAKLSFVFTKINQLLTFIC